MFARVSRFEGPPDAVDLTLAQMDEILPSLQDMNGFEGVMVLADRTTGTALSMTLWTDEAALRETERAADRIRTESATELGQQVSGVERYEVLFDVRGSDR